MPPSRPPPDFSPMQAALSSLRRDLTRWQVMKQQVDKRNTTSHTYNAAKAADVAAVIPSFADHAQELLTQLRARGVVDA